MHRSRKFLGGGALATALASAAFAQTVGFEGAVDVPVGDQPDATAIGDFDGDGFADLAVTSDAPDKVSILFNQGDGTFGAPVDVILQDGTSPDGVTAADLDGDHDLDLVVALHGSDEVQVVTNAGGVFTPGARYAVGARPVDVESGFLNGDAFPDVVTADRDGDSVSILLNQGDGTFGKATTIAIGQDLRDVALGDLDGDGDLDVAAASHDTRSVEILLNDGSGGFSAGPSLSVGSQLRPEGVTTADLDGDGRVDVAAATSGNGQNFVSIFFQGATGFGGRKDVATGGVDPASIVAADFDFDGDVDLAVANESSNDVSALENTGGGAFLAAVLNPVGLTPEHIAGGDLDGNGSIDLVTTNRDADTVSVLINLNANGWSDLGFALDGTNGTPHLQGFGPLRADTPASLVITNGRANALAFLIVGLDRIDAPFKGGTLVPAVDVITAFGLDGSGGATLSGDWPAGITAGEDFFFQTWFVDSGAVRGLAATNAVRAVAQ